MVLKLCLILFVPWFSDALPLPQRLVDLTYVYDETTLKFPIFKPFKIDGLVNGSQEDRGGQWLQYEEFSSGTHVGTHMDSPAHFIKGGLTVDEIPVSDFIAPSAVIDITDRAELDPGAQATVDDLLLWESGTGRTVNGSIIMLRTGWGKKWHNQTAFFGTSENVVSKLRFPGMSAAACQWLVDNRNIKGVGTETLSIDVANAKGSPCHVILLGNGHFILENVANMDQLPLYGAKLHVFPMKIGKASGAPTRIIATIPEVTYHLPSHCHRNSQEI